MMTKSTCIATVHLVHLGGGGGGGSLKTFIKVVKLNERLLHINEHYNVYTLNAFITTDDQIWPSPANEKHLFWQIKVVL